ncbi:TetR/AcrR family transcriptional regulator [Nocardia sp. MW-W600-9]
MRAQLRDGCLQEFAGRLDGPDPELRAELLGPLLVGLGALRSALGTPVLTAAPADRPRALVARMVSAPA